MSEAASPAVSWATTPELALQEAARHLERLGYEVLARRYREADLIAAAEGRLLVCGVRALGPLAAADANVGGPARRRLWRSAAGWLAEHGCQQWRSVRFDLIAVYLDRSGEPVGIEHTPDAF
jgi:Holliday junction resolvase-like predicted endonuclease